MSKEAESRSSRLAAVLAYIAVIGSACGVIGWYLGYNRGGAALDTSGFDIASAPESRLGDAASGVAPASERSGLSMIRSGSLARQLTLSLSSRNRPATNPRTRKAEENAPQPVPALSLANAARKHEQHVREFTVDLEARYPSLTQYARDWNAAPDLRALKDQYWVDRDPIRFAYGLARSPSFPALIKKYANDPGVQAYIAEGVKNAPAELLAAAAQTFQSDPRVQNLVMSVARPLEIDESVRSALAGAEPEPPKTASEPVR